MAIQIDKKITNLIKHLNTLSKAQLKYVLNLVDDDTLELFRQIFFNLNYNTLNLKGEKAEKLLSLMRNNQKMCEAIADDEVPVKIRRKYLKRQSASGLVTLALSVLAPVIANLVANAATKKK